MSSNRRLIEVAFPLKQTSIDSVHEKNVRHGHISTLHIWPARRPLAACRAALVATLLPDPENDEERKMILEKLGGKLVQRVKKVKNADGKVEEKVIEETEGGILHWGRESGPDLDWFRQKIREAYGGRAPKVLDPFAGGGAIPLEAMRLGCEVTAVDINPVAWFILKCTLEYPQKLAGQMRPLPDFALQDPEFMEAYFKAQGLSGQALKTRLADAGHISAEKQPQLGFIFLAEPTAQYGAVLEVDLAWHVRAWGRWVLKQMRRDLARFYPTYANFEPLVEVGHKVDTRPMQLVPLHEDGTPDLNAINAEFDEVYLKDKGNPRWVAKPTVAYLWARTVTCKNCRATIPLLKTRWLCKNAKRRVTLTMKVNGDKTGVVFGIQSDVPVVGKTSAQRREYEKQVGGGTMSRSGATCPCCGAIMTSEDIRLEGQAGRLGVLPTTVVVESGSGKGYRVPTSEEISILSEVKQTVEQLYLEIPFGLPKDPIPSGASRVGGGSAFTAYLYGLTHWDDLFTDRQLLTIGRIIFYTRSVIKQLSESKYSPDWQEAIFAYLTSAISKVTDRGSTLCSWTVGWDKIGHTFTRFALPITWDFAESVPIVDSSGGYPGALEWVTRYVEHAVNAVGGVPAPTILSASAMSIEEQESYDVILTDPPYYDAIPYAGLMDFFYVWLRRTLFGLLPGGDNLFSQPLSPKWDHEKSDGELIDDASRFEGDKERSKEAYEDGMYRVFRSCH